MYICKNCNTQSIPQQPSFLYNLQIRTKNYPIRIGVNQYIDLNGRNKFNDDPGGIGWEIVRQIQVCQPCFRYLTKT
ncbi:MAG: hypothetical protein OQJ89_15985 [Kangiellaceae bacterium]|nr:hypothetical protein [Kangiellaceae bacterium]MCW9000687.1 hypothetical protein [Kangiellaceae bacterium]MCW9018473.1 hypothetical protein [Kangiellaceae bacterium]